MTIENPTSFAEKFNFSGEIENSDFEIIEATEKQPGYREVLVILGNDEIGREGIKGLLGGAPFETKLVGVDMEVSHDGGDATPTEMMNKGYVGCKFLIKDTEGSDQAFTLYVKEDLDKLKQMLSA